MTLAVLTLSYDAFNVLWRGFLIFACAIVLPVLADEEREGKWLKAEEYRTVREEVLVIGKEPQWRKQVLEEQVWRPARFELPQELKQGRIEWFPAYMNDERDRIDGMRDRMGEKPEFKLFEWRF